MFNSKNNYFSVRTTINGFEVVFLINGDEDSVKRYVSMMIHNQFIVSAISEQLARDLFSVGFKIYSVPRMTEIELSENKQNS